MTRIQLFHSRDCSGNALRANALEALDHLGMDIPVEEAEAAQEHDGIPLPALAVNGSIIVSGVEPAVHELELLFADHLDRDGNSPCGSCGMGCGGRHCTEECPACPGKEKPGGVAGKIIGFIILLIILFTMVKILS